MKKIVSLLMCCVFSISAFAVFPQAKRSITVDEAEVLIRQMADYNETMRGDMTQEEYHISIDSLPATVVTDEELLIRLHKAARYEREHNITFYKLDGDYGKPSFWYDHARRFLTDEYVDEHIELKRALVQIGQDVYTYDSAYYMGAPTYPILQTRPTLKEHITIVDEDTVMIDVFYNTYATTIPMQLDFEYTENGWKICGGDAARAFLGSKTNTQNPDTSDNIIVIVVCATAALVGIALTANKRRFAR